MKYVLIALVAVATASVASAGDGAVHNSFADTLLVALIKGVLLLALFSPVLIYRYFKRKRDKARGIDVDAIERQELEKMKQEQEKAEKAEYNRFFKGY